MNLPIATVGAELAAVPGNRLRGKAPAADPHQLIERLGTAGADPAVIDATATWLMRRESVNSQTAYAKDASWWLSWCAAAGVNPAAARAIHADQYAAALAAAGLAKSTRGRRLAVASSWYEYLVRAEIADRNPFAGMDRPSVSADDSPTRGLTSAELAAMLTYSRENESTRTYALLVTLAITAGRITSVLTATVGAMGHDQGHRVLDLIVKGGKRKRVVLNPMAVEAIQRHLAARGEVHPADLLFPTSSGRPMDEPAAFRTVRRVAKAAGIQDHAQISPHSLRHSYATTMLDAGVPLADVQDAMGHADPRTTRRYDRARNSVHRSPAYRMGEELAKAMRAAS